MSAVDLGLSTDHVLANVHGQHPNPRGRPADSATRTLLRPPIEQFLRASMLRLQVFGTSYIVLSSMTGTFSGQSLSASPVLQCDLSRVIKDGDDGVQEAC